MEYNGSEIFFNLKNNCTQFSKEKNIFITFFVIQYIIYNHDIFSTFIEEKQTYEFNYLNNV